MAGGRVTTQMYSPQPEADYEKYKGVDVPEGDYIVKSAQGHYCLVYDREGRCTWEAPTSTMNGVSMQIVEVVTKAARKEYLSYLRDMGISYLITEEEEHPVRESLKKLKRFYGVERLVLTGGASINGGFLKEDMIDEFSIVVLPYVDGDKQHKALADTDGAFCDRAFYFAEAKQGWMEKAALLRTAICLSMHRNGKKKGRSDISDFPSTIRRRYWIRS